MSYSRFFELRILLALVPLLLTLQPLSAQSKSWVGKTIITKKHKIKIGYADNQGNPIYIDTLKGLDYKVIGEQGPCIKVTSVHGKRGWFFKKDAVLVENAVAYFTGVINSNPRDATAFNSRAMAWRLKGEVDIAIKDYSEAIQLDPNEPAYFNNRGNAWSDKKNYDKAIADYNDAIRLDPEYMLAYANRGYAWLRKKVYSKTIADYNEAIRLDSKFVWGYNNLAWLLATCPEPKYCDGMRAVELATKACELTNWKSADYLDTLAAAYAEAGQFEKALQHQKQALADVEFAKVAGDGANFRLKLYQKGTAYRQGMEKTAGK